MVNQAGSIVAKYTYDPWGKVLSVKDGSNNDVSNNQSHVANVNPIRYAGYRYDTETALYYLLARYYDPGSFRFLTKDPDGGDKDRPLSQNPYAYAEGNPVNRVDPDGEYVELRVAHTRIHMYFGEYGDSSGQWWDKHFLPFPGYAGDKKWHNHFNKVFPTGIPLIDLYRSTLKPWFFTPGRKKPPKAVTRPQKRGKFNIRFGFGLISLRRR